MHLRRHISGRKGEDGVVILLVAVVLLFVVGAMAVLAIDLVSFYTARSEAQLAADSAALAGARVLANTGATSASSSDIGLRDNAKDLAEAIAKRVAAINRVGGRNLDPATEVNVSFPGSSSIGGAVGPNPRISVRVTRSDLPTFFARIWGSTQLSLSATAIAEAYNPSGLNTATGDAPPVAPTCVKPWVLPNISPADDTSAIFDTATGAIQDRTLIGWTDPAPASSPPKFYSRCTGTLGNCIWDDIHVGALAWRYYPALQSSFPGPTGTLQSCSTGFQPYQRSIAGCVTKPIACNSRVNLDTSNYLLRNTQTGAAVNCLTHSERNKGDTVAVLPPGAAFQFNGGDDNPIAGVAGKNILVSDSLVTVPVYAPSPNGVAPPTAVSIIGFVQLFLNPDGNAAGFGYAGAPHIRTTIINLVGCGTNAAGTPILGNGASPVAVRLVAPSGGT